MKNLNLCHVSTQKHHIESEHKFCICYGHTENSTNGDFFVCTHNLIVSNYDSDGEIKWTKDLSESATPDNTPVNITLLSLINCVSVGLANGELFTISDFGSNCDLAGVCENGLLAMEWSPDQELLVLVTKDLKMILMSCTFDPINECKLISEEFGDKQFITVGWGKKETQFHGSEGKQAATKKTQVIAEEHTESSNKVSISWRGDGNLFAVGFSMEGIRRFKIFDREGALQYTSETQPGLETNLSWRPSGNLIATTQKISDRKVISFFEKNGLKHGEFTIPVNTNTVIEDLLWSSDSEILTVLCKDTITNTQQILLFTTSNYHWYLKQTLDFNEKQTIAKIMWDNDFDVRNNKKMHIILQNGQHFSYTWIWNINHTNGKSNSDDAVVTVIDGTKILITGFRHTVVPPPMSNLEIEFESYVNSVCFAPENCCNLDSNTIAVHTNNGLVFLEQSQKNPLQYKITKTVHFDKSDFPFQSYNWHWLDDENFLCIAVDTNNSHHIMQYNISANKLSKVNEESLPSAATKIHSHPLNSTSVFLQLESGDILEYKSDGTINPQDVSFPESCPIFKVLSVDNEIYFLGLSHKGCLYMNEKMIMNNVNSLFIHTSYILLTTLKHTLLCAELTKGGLDSIVDYDKTESSNVYKRKIERGSKLVIAVPRDTRTILQMPRGNLETIQPRPLSLKIIGEYLDSHKYVEAFDLMRKQRINLNLFYDHNPKLFTDSISIFLTSIKNNSWLSLFLSDLENVDVTKTMYSSSYPDRNIVDAATYRKIHYVCDIVREHLIKSEDHPNRILPLLTTFVKKNTIDDLEAALKVIKDLKDQESAGSKLPVASDEALKYLLYMVNVDHLFDVALGMYDFDLVLLVANKSQKDPKEYIPMLNELNEMDENYKKFTINKHLKRFDRAVQCLAKCGTSRYGELKTFVKYHSLYREALSLFPTDDEIYKQISDDFGLYLKLKKQYLEAGIIYEHAKSIEKAIECYKDALEWELAIKLAQQNASKDEINQLCWVLANALKDKSRHKESLTLLELFCDNKKDVIFFAIESGQYKTALRMCTQYDLVELIEKNIQPSLLEEYANTKDLIETNWANFIKYKNRLMVVREIKRKQPLDIYDAPYGNKDSDLYSDAGSTIASSSGSGRSFRSSKNRRKHERKVASLKEGSQYEDTALVMALHNLIQSSFSMRMQVKEINIALSCLNKDKEALILQSILEKLLKEMKDNFKTIWSNEFTLEAINAVIAAENVPEGSSVIPQGMATLEPYMRVPPVVSDVIWKLDGLNL